MDNYERLEQKIDKMAENIAKINITLVSQHHSLKEHMHRSELNEKAIELLKEEMIPVQKHVQGLSYVLKAFGAAGVVVSIIAGILKIKSLLF